MSKTEPDELRSDGSTNGWVSEPEASEESVLEATGRGWNDWCDLIEAWPGHSAGHSEVAAWLEEVHDLPGWWAQTVTVGWERITGRRLPHQRADGSFTASRSRTLDIDGNELRDALLEDASRAELLAEHTAITSRPGARTIRVEFRQGVALIAIDQLPDDRCRVSVEHKRLTSPDELAHWQQWWTDWLAALPARTG